MVGQADTNKLRTPVRLTAGVDISVNGFLCATCSAFHDDLPMCLGAPAPALWQVMTESERDDDSELSSDQCVIQGMHFFVLGRLLLPVIDGQGPFVWLVWVSLNEKSFLRVNELWEQEGRESEPPYFGWLQSALPYEPTTLGLKASVQTSPVGERPVVTLEAMDHPLSIEQRDGINMARVQEIVEAALHG